MLKTKKTPRDLKLFYPLVQNDLIEIIAPGSSAPPENLEKGEAVLRSWGLQVQYDPEMLKPDMYLSNSDAYRFNAFKKAMTNPKVKGIWCLRGGYGANRLLPLIEKMKVPRMQKLLIGFSDVTSLHQILNQKWNWPSLHGSLIDRLAAGSLSPENLKELRESLFESPTKILFSNLIPLNKFAKKKKVIKAKLVGGNLLVVTSSIGTPSQIKTKGRILFFEEIAERAYRVDRCLQQLKQANLLINVEAVVFGDFTRCEESDGKDLIHQTLINFFSELKIPAFMGLQVGHGQVQRPLFLNTPNVLTCGANPKLVNYGPL